jgi:predicted DNA-binding ribbon-helix-helix protein
VTNLVKRSFSLAGHRTSVALEPEFWAVLARLAVAERVTLAGLVARLDGQRSTEQPLASMLRVYALTERF